MSLVLRTQKGTALTHTELDNNQKYLEGLGKKVANAQAIADASVANAQAAVNAINTKFTVSINPPSGGKNGDIWFQIV